MLDTNPDEWVPETPAPGPITDAYLHHDIHPDELPGTKPVHASALHAGSLFPKSGEEELPPCSQDETWMWH